MNATASPASRRTATEIRVVPVEQLAVPPERAAELLSMSDDFFRKHVLPHIAVVYVGRLRLVPTRVSGPKGPQKVRFVRSLEKRALLAVCVQIGTPWADLDRVTRGAGRRGHPKGARPGGGVAVAGGAPADLRQPQCSGVSGAITNAGGRHWRLPVGWSAATTR